eukprot:UN00585
MRFVHNYYDRYFIIFFLIYTDSVILKIGVSYLIYFPLSVLDISSLWFTSFLGVTASIYTLVVIILSEQQPGVEEENFVFFLQPGIY